MRWGIMAKLSLLVCVCVIALGVVGGVAIWNLTETSRQTRRHSRGIRRVNSRPSRIVEFVADGLIDPGLGRAVSVFCLLFDYLESFCVGVQDGDLGQ